MPCDAVTLGDWFEANGLAEMVGGAGYLIELANTTPSAANITAYAEIVREKSVLRQLIDAGTGSPRTAIGPKGMSVQEVLESAEQRGIPDRRVRRSRQERYRVDARGGQGRVPNCSPSAIENQRPAHRRLHWLLPTWTS